MPSITIHLADELMQWLERAARDEGCDVSAIVARLVEDAIEGKPEEPKAAPAPEEGMAAAAPIGTRRGQP